MEGGGGVPGTLCVAPHCPASQILVKTSGYVPCTLPRRCPAFLRRVASPLKAVVDSGRRRANGGDSGTLAGACEKTSGVHAPETSYRCPGACARAVEAAVVANGGRWWGTGMQEGAVGAKGWKLNQRPLSTLPEQYDSDESTAGGASEWFRMDSATEKTVGSKFIRCMDAWNLPSV